MTGPAPSLEELGGLFPRLEPLELSRLVHDVEPGPAPDTGAGPDGLPGAPRPWTTTAAVGLACWAARFPWPEAARTSALRRLLRDTGFRGAVERVVGGLESGGTVSSFYVSVFDDHYLTWTGRDDWDEVVSGRRLARLPGPHVYLCVVDLAPLLAETLHRRQATATEGPRP